MRDPASPSSLRSDMLWPSILHGQHADAALYPHDKMPRRAFIGADRENRTPDWSLARTRFTTKPYPQVQGR